MPLIFLSHSSADEIEAVALQRWLADNGWDDVFLDLDPERGLAAGERWQEALRRAADRCEAVVFIVSQAWAKSKWCLAEFLLAKSLHKQIFGVLLREVPLSELPVEMTSEWQLCQLTGPGMTETVTFRHRGAEHSVEFLADGLKRLKTGLQKAGLQADFFPWPPKDDAKRSPFRGLAPLDIPDAAVFFGRDVEILRALDVLRGLRLSPDKSLFVILGASGAGKSSFLRAGLLPRLARDDRHFLPLGVVRPERAPISGDRGLAQALHQTMMELGLSKQTPSDLKAMLLNEPADFEAILQTVREAARSQLLSTTDERAPPAPTLILPVDQAEELFNADASAEARQFLTLIGKALKGSAQSIDDSATLALLIVAFTIRSDRYEPLQTAPELADLQTAVFDDLKPMPATRFREVITGPARRTSISAGRLEIKPDLVDKLVEDCGTGADTLPLLGLTLERLYHDCGSDGDLRLDEYLAMGGLGNIVTNKIEAVLDHDVERRALQLALLRSAFIPWLVTINPQNGQPMRRVARRSDLPAESLPLVDALAENRLLTRDQRQGATVIEVAHEMLLRKWDQLAGWLQDQRADLKEAEALERQTREWEENGEHESWHWGGQRLADALALAAQPGFRERLQPCAAFLEASRKRETEDRERELQNQRLLQEAETAKALAEARAERERAEATERQRQKEITIGQELVGQAQALWTDFQETGNRHPDDWRLSRLAEIENRLCDALIHDRTATGAIDMLGGIRRLLVETGIKTQDLNLASIYLQKLKTTPGVEGTVPSQLGKNLEAAWAEADPARNPYVQRLRRWALAGSWVPLLWTVSLALIVYLVSREPEFPLWVICTGVLAIALHCVAALFAVMTASGDERRVSWTRITAIFILFIALAGLNLVSILIAAILVSSAGKIGMQKLLWPKPILRKR